MILPPWKVILWSNPPPFGNFLGLWPPHPPGISNSLRGGGLDIFWNYTIQKVPLGLCKWFLQLLTTDSGWAFNDVSYRVCYHGWLVALRGKLSDVASQDIIAFCWTKGALQNVNMLTVSKSGRSYIPGKPLSSDLRHIIIDKIIEWVGDPLTMIFPSRFVNLVSIEHASVLARYPLLPSQPCFLLCEYQYLRPTLILILLAPLSKKPFICKLKYFLDKSTSSTVLSSFTVIRNKFIPPRWGTSFTMHSMNLLYSRLISSFSTVYTGVILFVE